MDVIATSMKDNGATTVTNGAYLLGFHHRTYPRRHQSGFHRLDEWFFFTTFLLFLGPFLNVFDLFEILQA